VGDAVQCMCVWEWALPRGLDMAWAQA
jgi:hypothetical protein